MVGGTVVDTNDLPQLSYSVDASEPDSCFISLNELRKRHTKRVLEQVRGNKKRAAEILGISGATIYQILASAETENPTSRSARADEGFAQNREQPVV